VILEERVALNVDRVLNLEEWPSRGGGGSKWRKSLATDVYSKKYVFVLVFLSKSFRRC
jgi:hypothetical protein